MDRLKAHIVDTEHVGLQKHDIMKADPFGLFKTMIFPILVLLQLKVKQLKVVQHLSGMRYQQGVNNHICTDHRLPGMRQGR